MRELDREVSGEPGLRGRGSSAREPAPRWLSGKPRPVAGGMRLGLTLLSKVVFSVRCKV